MGLISTMTRRVRNNRLSRRLSTTSTKLHDEDANDLIKTLSGTSRVPSMDSTSTIVYQNPVVPSESPANRGLIKTKDMHVGSLFDQEMASRSADRAARALAGQEYPVLRLDMCQSAEPRRALQEPLEMGGMGKRRSRGWKEDYGNGGLWVLIGD
ncbi:hypothetical protein N7457_001277 [Penicillium paradoxum]|uniref:uncharacterized protein n=1 Tax=Penicillium paradoxum TaxID=176176 RepID=UPI00254962B6|nr:uncharacterized protein N7457_001277 [Penicillium paradoxum]KAJ5794678.1 hypothetical protein N7457_001277 [Penicillium paradoxum]